jgi:hypothetical protein
VSALPTARVNCARPRRNVSCLCKARSSCACMLHFVKWPSCAHECVAGKTSIPTSAHPSGSREQHRPAGAAQTSGSSTAPATVRWESLLATQGQLPACSRQLRSPAPATVRWGGDVLWCVCVPFIINQTPCTNVKRQGEHTPLYFTTTQWSSKKCGK